MLVYPIFFIYMTLYAACRESLDQESLLVIGECGKELDRRTMYQWQGNVVYIYQLADMTTAYIPNTKTAIWDNWQTCMDPEESVRQSHRLKRLQYCVKVWEVNIKPFFIPVYYTIH